MITQINNPQLDFFKAHILIKKNYLMALEKRLELCRFGYALKNEYERNEVDIIVCETLLKSRGLASQIKELEAEFKSKLKEFLSKL